MLEFLSETKNTILTEFDTRYDTDCLEIEEYPSDLELSSEGWYDTEQLSVHDLSYQPLENLDTRINKEGVQEICIKYENVNTVLEDIKKECQEATTDLDLQAQDSRIEKYKGTVFEDMCKEELTGNFAEIEEKQRLVETKDGSTKPDIVLHDAKQDMMIGSTEIKKGQDLYCEVKCGSKEYIANEMDHMIKQVQGHQEGQSVVIVTNDYLEISPEKRAGFENKLDELNSSVHVVNVESAEVTSSIYDYLLQA